MFIFTNNILKTSKSARARQIYENEIAFKNVIKTSFMSIIADDFMLSRIFKNESNGLRKIFFHLYFVFKVILLNRNSYVYSRNLSIVYLANKLGFNVIWEGHDLPKGINMKFLKKMVNQCKIVTISKALADKICLEYKFSPAFIFVAHDGVDIELYDKYRNSEREAIRKKFNIPLEKKIILHSGSIMKERGSLLFKEVLSVLPDWYFVQVGGNLKDIEFLRSELKTFDNFLFIPHQDVETLIQLQLCSDALFYMITKETSTYWCCSPMKIFEYLASGKPIVASNIGSLNEILSKDVAILYDPEDRNSLQQALLKLADGNASIELSKNAVSLVRQKYTWKIRAQQILSFLKLN